jgi:hypothetical protein
MARRDERADVERITHVLAGIPWPAAKWQLISYAEEYGADAATRADLWSLPPGTYSSLSSVLGALGLTPGPRGRRPRPLGPAARRPAR